MNEIRIEIEGLKELTEAVKMLAGMNTGVSGMTNAVGMAAAGMPVQPAPAPVPVGTPAQPVPTSAPVSIPAQQNYGQTPVPPVTAVGTAAQMQTGNAAPVSSVPTTAMPQGYTLEQLQVAAAGLSGMGKMPQVMGILQQFGIQAMTELPKERYGEFATALREAGAQI